MEKTITEKFYNNDGSFKPLTSSEGNVYDNLSYLRNTYMECEREYFVALLSIKEIREMFLRLVRKNAYKLFDYALELQARLENGELEKI